MNITAKTKMCIIIGDPIEHSLSPAMHNVAYEYLGIDDEFVFTAAHVKPVDLKTVVQAVRAMNIHGLTCTIPHKVEVMQYLDEVDEVAKKIGAVNTVVNKNGKLKGYNTDWLGVVTPLEKVTSLKNKKVALVGAGGAARAMAFGVLKLGADLTIFNRSVEKAEEIANDLGDNAIHPIVVKSIDEISNVIDDDIILNATSLGMGDKINETPVPKKYLAKHHIVFDTVYFPSETRLLKEAQEQESVTIQGLEMLLQQGIAQFELYTGHKAPEDVMREILFTTPSR